MPERVVNLSLRSGGAADLALVSDMARPQLFDSRAAHVARSRAEARPLQNLLNEDYSFRARRKDVTAKNRNNRATATAMPMSQRATSRVQARSAALRQPRSRTAKTPATASSKTSRSPRHTPR